MSYAIISLGGKQYRVSEGQRLLVDRLKLDDGATFTPSVLLVGGDGSTELSPEGVTVTARVVSQQRGPKIRIGKYRQRTGFKRHNGFRSSLTQIEIETIGAGKKARAGKAEESPAVEAAPVVPVEAVPTEAVPTEAVETEAVETEAVTAGAVPSEEES
jgi:large subunit ribosomal protein L21